MFGVERLHLKVQCMVQVRRDGSCLVCTALSKAPAAVEDLVDQKQTSCRPYNGRLISENTTTRSSKASKSSAAALGNGIGATDTPKSTRQLKGRAGALPSPTAKVSPDQSSTVATSDRESSAQQSSASLRQSDAAPRIEDTLLQDRQRSSSGASTSSAPLEEEPASEESLQPPFSAFSGVPTYSRPFRPLCMADRFARQRKT